MSKEQNEEKHELSESIYMSGYGLLRKDCDDIAEQLYSEGYRKQIKGFWSVAKVYNEYLMSYEIKTVCGLCGHTLGYEGCVLKTNYCPNCGAKMKGA